MEDQKRSTNPFTTTENRLESFTLISIIDVLKASKWKNQCPPLQYEHVKISDVLVAKHFTDEGEERKVALVAENWWTLHVTE